jgi:uncharacterized membrane protein
MKLKAENEIDLLCDRIDELNETCNYLREQLEEERRKSKEVVDKLTGEIKDLSVTVGRLQLHVQQGVEL